MSLTDEICLELWDGLEKGLDWQQFLAKHSASKGPLYNALARVMAEGETRIAALNERRTKLQEDVNQSGLTLDSLDRKTKEADSNIVSLENRTNALSEQVETLETKLTEKSELAKHLAELGNLGFDSERLRQLREALKDIGMRHGLKGKEVVSKFFDTLEDYEVVFGAEMLLEGLQTQIETRKLEAENWQAKEEALRREHDDLKEALGAVHALRTRGIKVSQVVTWHRVLKRFDTIEQFDESLAQYGDITKLLNARKEEAGSHELRLAKAQSQVETLEKERVRIEGAIDALKVAGVKELEVMTKEATKQLQAVAASEIRETQAVGQEVRGEFSSFFAQLDTLVKKVFEMGQEFERMRQGLQKYEGVKEVFESHTVATEAEE